MPALFFLSLLRKAAIAKAPKLEEVTGRDVRLALPPRETHFPAKANEVKPSIWGKLSWSSSHVSSSSQQTAGRTSSSVSRLQSVRREGKPLPKESHSFRMPLHSLSIPQNCLP